MLSLKVLHATCNIGCRDLLDSAVLSPGTVPNATYSAGCADEGFEVGHTRNTQTKGIWVWAQPQPVVVDGQPASMIFMDTEGFEATGKSDACKPSHVDVHGRNPGI